MDELNLFTLSSIVSPPNSWKELNEKAENLTKSLPVASTPSLDHLTRKDYEHVYEPSDDTFLFLDGLSYEYDNSPEWKQLRGAEGNTIKDDTRTLEIGVGTGAVTIHFAKLCQSQTPVDDSTIRKRRIHYVTDINPHAIEITKRTAIANGLCVGDGLSLDASENNEEQLKDQCVSSSTIEAVQCDLASGLLPELRGKVGKFRMFLIVNQAFFFTIHFIY